MPHDQLPMLLLSPIPLTLKKMNQLAEHQDYMSIIVNNSSEDSHKFFQFIAKKIMEYALENKSEKSDVEQMIEWVKCLYGSSITAARIFLNNSDLVRVPHALHFCLSFYNQKSEYSLPLQLLTSRFLENKALEMPVFRALRYLTSLSDDEGSQDLKGISSEDWNRKELLKGERVYIGNLIQPLTRDSGGHLTQEIINRLELPAELYLDDLVLPLPMVCFEIIIEYLSSDEQKDLRIQYPALNPSSMLLKQIETLEYQLKENRDIVDQLQRLLRYPAICKHWLKKYGIYIAGGVISIAGIISLPFNMKRRAQYNASLIANSSFWPECMEQGYKLNNSPGYEICDKHIPEPSIPECNDLCDQLLNEPAEVTIWFIITVFMIVAPVFIVFWKKCCRADRAPNVNIIPNALNTVIDQHYRHSNERAPVKIEERSSQKVGILITSLTERQPGLQTSLENLEKKRALSLLPIHEEERPVVEDKASPPTDFFKLKTKKLIEITTPLLRNDIN